MDLDSARAMNIDHSTVCITAPRVSRLNPLGADIAPKPAKLTLPFIGDIGEKNWWLRLSVAYNINTCPL